jgi:hypothetical protein
MVSALVLGEDLAGLMKLGVTLTAPVLECYLVAQAPMVLVPRDARFLGSVWDAEARTLTVRLSGRGKTTLMLAHSAEPKSAANAVKTGISDGRIHYSVALNGATEITFQF